MGLARRNPEKLKAAGIKERIIGLLKEKEEDALFSRELATIKKDVPLEFSLSDCAFKSFDSIKIEALFRELGFMSLLARINPGKDRPVAKNETMTMEFSEDSLGKSSTFYWAEHEGKIYIVSGIGEISEMIASNSLNAKTRRAYDAKKIMRLAKNTLPFEDDLQIMYWLLNPGRSNPKLSDVLAMLFPQESIVMPQSLKFLPQTYEILSEELRQKSLIWVYKNIEMPLIPVLSRLEQTGIACDAKILGKASVEIREKIRETEKVIYKYAGENFNINSTRDLSRVLFEKLSISTKGIRKTDGGKTSTKFSELIKMQKNHPIIQKIIEYRELAKIISTYIDALPKTIGPDGRIHTTFHQTGTVTGRLSSAEPNLQNIPAKSEFGDVIRRAFYAKPPRVFMAFDYSQMQLRIAAHLSQDKKLLEFFKEGKDVHRAVAAEVFGVRELEVTPEMRRRAKTINFGILYGMGAQALAENLEVSREEAAIFLEDYFLKFADLAGYFDELKRKAAMSGYVETIFGRRRYLPEINSMLVTVKREAERMALNTPIQGSEADIMKIAMAQVSDKIVGDKALNGKIAMVLQIHDELLFEAEKDVLDHAVKTLKPIMENIIENKIALPVDVKCGPNWAELRPCV